MLAQRSILIVEDDPYLALDLSMTVEDLDGRVIGPTRKLDEATAMLDSGPVAAAIVDCHVPDQDMRALADLLAERCIPFVLHATGHLSHPKWGTHGDVPVLIKPLQPRAVLAQLLIEMHKAAGRIPAAQLKKVRLPL